jgi:hypothetical protein
LKYVRWVARVALALAAWTVRLVGRVVYAAYLLAFRTALYVTTLFLVAYFVVNSSWFNGVLYGVIDDALPGAIGMETIQWGPLPWQVRVTGVDITHPDGGSVIVVDALYAEVDLLDLFAWLGPELAHVAGLPGADAVRTGFHIRIDAAVLRDYYVEVNFESSWYPRIAEAFDDGIPSDGPPGKPARVYIRNAFGANGRCTLDFPEFSLDWRGVEFTHGSVTVEPGGVTVYTPTTTIAEGDMRFPDAAHPFGGGELLVPVSRFLATDFALLRDRIHIGAANAKVSESQIATFGQLAFPSEEPTQFDAELRIDAPGPDPLLTRMLAGHFSPPLQAWISGEGDFVFPSFALELATANSALLGLPVESGRASAVLARSRAAPGEGLTVSVPALRLDVAQGNVRVDDAALELSGLNGYGRLSLDGVHLATLLNATPLQALRSDSASGRSLVDTLLTGEVDISHFSLGTAPELAATIGAGGLLAHPQDPLTPLGRFGPLRLDGSVFARTAGGGTLTLAPMRLQAVPLSAELSAVVRGGTQWVHAQANASVAALDDLLAVFSTSGARGSLSLEDVSVAGPLRWPNVERGRVELRQLRLGSTTIGDVDTRLASRGSFFELIGATVAGSFAAAFDAEVVPFVAHFGNPHPTTPFWVTRAEIAGVALETFSPAHKGALSAARVEARGALFALGRTLEARGDLEVVDVEGFPLPVPRVEGRVEYTPTLVKVPSARVYLEGAGVLAVEALEVGASSGRVRGAVRAQDLVLSGLARAAGLPLELGGTASLELNVDFGGADKRVDGTVSVADFATNGVPLGGAAVSLQSVGGGRIALHSSEFFQDTELLPDSELQLSRPGAVLAARGGVALTAFDPLPLLASPALAGWQAQVSGVLRGEVALLNAGGAVASAELALDEGGFEAQWEDGLDTLTVRSRESSRLRLTERGTFSADRLVLKLNQQLVGLCGTVDPDGSSNLFLQVAGPFDIPLQLRGSLSALDGAVRTAGSPQDFPGADRSCLDAMGPLSPDSAEPSTGAIWLAGPLSDPRIAGKLELDVESLRVRGLPRDFRLDDGAVIEFAREREGGAPRQLVRTPDGSPLRGRYGDGSFALDAALVLDGFAPRALDAHVDLVNVDHAVSNDVRMRFNAGLDIEGRDLSGAGRDLLVAGTVSIVEGVVTSESALDTQLFDSATGNRRLSGASRSLVDSAPWLAQTRLDLEATSSNVQVRLNLPVGQADMELRLNARVGGTVAEPEVFGRVDVAPGSLIRNTVIGREFEIARASIDFDGPPLQPRLDAQLRAEVTFQESRTTNSLVSRGPIWSSFSGFSAQERTVVVTVSLAGRADFDNPGRELEDISVDLTSDSGNYERSELFTLLVTGVPPGAPGDEASRGGAMVNIFADQLASLLAGTLLGVFIDTVNVGISLTGGLDWQLRKSFGKNLRVSVAGFQDATGQRVEPRFELRITERLSLEGSMRYQNLEQFSGQTYEAKLRYRIPLDD